MFRLLAAAGRADSDRRRDPAIFKLRDHSGWQQAPGSNDHDPPTTVTHCIRPPGPGAEDCVAAEAVTVAARRRSRGPPAGSESSKPGALALPVCGAGAPGRRSLRYHKSMLSSGAAAAAAARAVESFSTGITNGYVRNSQHLQNPLGC
jgi:hypothetical protein